MARALSIAARSSRSPSAWPNAALPLAMAEYPLSADVLATSVQLPERRAQWPMAVCRATLADGWL